MEKGFTLIEIMISIFISSIVLTSVYALFFSLGNNLKGVVHVSDMQHNTRAALDCITSELKQAGADPLNNVFSETNPPIKVAGKNMIHFEMDITGATGKGDPDGLISGTSESIIFSLYDSGSDGDLDLGRKRDGGRNIAVSENIELLNFYYFDKDLNLLGDGSGNIANTEDIKGVLVAVLGRSETSEKSYKNHNEYIADLPDGSSVSVFKGVGDGYKRYLLSSFVYLNNVGLTQ